MTGIQSNSNITITLSKVVRAFETAISKIGELANILVGSSHIEIAVNSTALLRDFTWSVDGDVNIGISKNSRVCDD